MNLVNICVYNDEIDYQENITVSEKFYNEKLAKVINSVFPQIMKQSKNYPLHLEIQKCEEDNIREWYADTEDTGNYFALWLSLMEFSLETERRMVNKYLNSLDITKEMTIKIHRGQEEAVRNFEAELYARWEAGH